MLMRKLLFLIGCLFAAFAAKAQVNKYDVNSDWVVNTADVVEIYNDIANGANEAPIACPEEVSAEIKGDMVLISWTAVDEALTYAVFRSADGENFAILASSIGSTQFVDSKPLEGDNYYAIMSIGERQTSKLSEAVKVSYTYDNDDEFDEPKTYDVNGVQFTMVAVEGGTFQMGSNDGNEDEKPVHSVTLSDYYIGKTEVTQALWEAVMGSNPSGRKGDNMPVETVSWYDCQSFITKLNELTGENFRLPTEAEWEFAAKGGNKSKGYIYSGSDNVDDVAWIYGNAHVTTYPVGTKAPNELGIYDMTGNVEEFCQDWYGSYSGSAQTNPTGPSSGSRRVSRGGSYDRHAPDCRITHRASYLQTGAGRSLGFRLAR